MIPLAIAQSLAQNQIRQEKDASVGVWRSKDGNLFSTHLCPRRSNLENKLSDLKVSSEFKRVIHCIHEVLPHHKWRVDNTPIIRTSAVQTYDTVNKHKDIIVFQRQN
jgi:hypothetical protein